MPSIVTNKKISSFILTALLLSQFAPFFSGVVYAEEVSLLNTVPNSSISITGEDVVPASHTATGNSSNEPSISTNQSSTTEKSAAASRSLDAAITSGTTQTNEVDSVPTLTVQFPDFITTSTTTLGSLLVTTSSSLDTDKASTTSELSGGAIDSIVSASSGEATNNEVVDVLGELPSGTTTIQTGKSIALANILNIVNTNLINSTGSIFLTNMFDGYTGTLDFRNGASSTSTSSCTLLACNGIDSITANINADAAISNIVAVVASTGENLIEGRENAVITTGATIAGLNLVNVANANFIDSNYFLLALNSFNTVTGDIILPSPSSFFSTAYRQSAGIEEVGSTQISAITNNLDVDATTGGNSTEALYGVTKSGNSTSATNIYNASNSTLVGGNSISLLLKVSGTWLGELFGLPSGSAFIQDGNNKILHYEDGVLQTNNRYAATEVMSTTTAIISNDVTVKAGSGNNRTKDTINSVIESGDSLAAANIINIANTNVIGRNWILAIINIFGDFNGNISFGQPDLWLGQQVTGEGFITNDTALTHTITVTNKGDSNGNNVRVTSLYDKVHLDIIDASIPYTVSEKGDLVFVLGTLLPNETQKIIFHAKIKNTTEGIPISTTSTATLTESENNISNNSDSTTIITSSRSMGGSSFTITPIVINPAVIIPQVAINSNNSQAIVVKRDTVDMTLVGKGSEGEQVVTIRNTSGTTFPSALFNDVLYDLGGKKVQTETFELGTILPFEEITLTYKLSFGSQALPGVYTLASEFSTQGSQDLIFHGNGRITYVPFPQQLLNKENDTSQVQVVASSIVPLSLKSNQIAPLTFTTQIKKRSILGAFAESFLPETAYAGEGQSTAQAAEDTSYFMIYFLLFLLVSTSHIYFRVFRKMSIRS